MSEWKLIENELPKSHGWYMVTIKSATIPTEYYEREDIFDIKRNEFMIHRDIIAWREGTPYLPKGENK